MTKLIVPITPEPLTGVAREAEMFELKFTREWEIETSVDIYLKNAQGERLFDAALTAPGLTQLQRDNAREKYFPMRKTYTTKGSKVNEQGEVAEDGTINEIDFLNGITFGQLKTMLGKTDEDSVLLAIKEFVGGVIQDISERGQN